MLKDDMSDELLEVVTGVPAGSVVEATAVPEAAPELCTLFWANQVDLLTLARALPVSDSSCKTEIVDEIYEMVSRRLQAVATAAVAMVKNKRAPLVATVEVA